MWELIRGAASRRGRQIDLVKAEITLQAMYRLQDFLLSGATLAFPSVIAPVVSVVLVLYNRAELTFGCLRSLKGTDLPLEIVAIDNGSSDLTAKLFERAQGVRYVRNAENKHFVRGTNQGAKLCSGKYLLLLNSDTEVVPGSLEAAVNALETDPLLGAVGGRLILPDGSLQEAGCFVWQEGICQGYGRGDDPTSGPYMFPRLVDFCSGAFLLTPRSVWTELGGFDELFVPAYYEEVDYCMRLWEAGRPVRYEPRAVIWHYEFASSQTSTSPMTLMNEHQRSFADKHVEVLRDRPKTRSIPDVMMRSRSLEHKPKVLFCDAMIPHPRRGSGFPRANQILRSLLDLGCEVTCLPTEFVDLGENWISIAADIPLEAEILALGSYGPDAVKAVLQERQGYYDHLLVSRPASMNALRPFLTRHQEWFRGMKLVYDAEAIFALREVREERLQGKEVSEAEVEERVREELSLCAGFDKILTVSKEEASYYARNGFDAYLVGHAATDEPGEPAWAARQDILFVGTILRHWTPNADSVMWFLEHVWPELRRRLPLARFVIAGLNCLPQLIDQPPAERVIITGMVDDLTPFYNNARVFVAPTRASSGIPLKVIEAAGRGVPVVASSLLVSQLGWDSPREILQADRGPEFLEACVALYNDERSWHLQREAALARVAAEYSPAMLAQQLKRALNLRGA